MSRRYNKCGAVFAGAILHPDPGRCHCHRWPFGCWETRSGCAVAAPTSTGPLWGHVGCDVGWSFFQCSTMSLCHWDLFLDEWNIIMGINMTQNLYQVIQELCSNAVISSTSHTLMSSVGVLWVPNSPPIKYRKHLVLSSPFSEVRVFSEADQIFHFGPVLLASLRIPLVETGGNLGCFWWFVA